MMIWAVYIGLFAIISAIPEKYIGSIIKLDALSEWKCVTVFIWLQDWVFPSLDWLQITISVLRDFAKLRVLPFLNNPKGLDPSYKMDLDFWDCFGRKNLHLIT